jgi:hypothetical protein
MGLVKIYDKGLVELPRIGPTRFSRFKGCPGADGGQNGKRGWETRKPVVFPSAPTAMAMTRSRTARIETPFQLHFHMLNQGWERWTLASPDCAAAFADHLTTVACRRIHLCAPQQPAERRGCVTRVREREREREGDREPVCPYLSSVRHSSSLFCPPATRHNLLVIFRYAF